MNIRYFVILALITIFFSLGCVSAVDYDNLNNISEIDFENNELDCPIVNEDNILENSFEDKSAQDESDNIYVGTNTNPSGANGSSDNPYATLQDACSHITNKESVTLKIFEGTYEIGEVSDLTFDTKNLRLEPVTGNVIFKSMYNDDPNYDYEDFQLAISLKNTKSSCTFSNITFDLSECKVEFWKGFFTPFIGDQINLTYEGCIFKGFSRVDGTSNTIGASIFPIVRQQAADISNSNIAFNNCFFIDSSDSTLGGAQLFKSNITFNFCSFVTDFKSSTAGDPNSIIFNSNWFGKNEVPTYAKDFARKSKIVNYAIFDIVENYLGDNNYEIIGKLVYNGTDEVIENLPAMTVSLTPTGGTLESETATLENGTFKVRYTSTDSINKVTATLDNAVVDLNFATINMEASANPIEYGADQNITVTLPEAMDGTITIKVNNKTYTQQIFGEQVSVYQITEEILNVGNYTVNVTFTSEDGHSHASANCYLNVSKVSQYSFDATITPSSVYIGDSATVILSLPDGATGNVTVKVGDNEAKTFNSDDEISIDGFVAGDNVVNITFSSDMYDAKSVVKTVVASVKPTTLTTVNVTTTYNVAKDLVITLTDVNGKVLANKTVNVVVGTVNKNLTTNASGQVSMDISTLAPNTYVANIAFAGDEVYAKANATANVVVNKIASSLTAPAVTATYNVGKNLVITLTANGKALANQKVTVKVGTISKTLTTNAKGQVSVDVSKLTPKTYTATFTYAGDDINDKSSNTAKVVVNKATPKMIAKKATFKAKKKTKKYSIVLKDNKGKAIKKAKVTLKVKGKTYKATTNAKGKATFKITKLTKKGKQTATIKFGGNTLYKAVSKKVKLTIKK